MSKDPRKALYEALTTAGETDLITEVKDYFSAMIGKDESLTDVQGVQDKLDALQIKYDTQSTELTTAQNAPANKEGFVSVEQFNALKNDFTAEVQKGVDATNDANSAKLTSSLDTLLGKVDPVTKSAVVAALKGGDGYSLGGKTYKASYADGTTLFTVDGESATSDTGITSLMEAGLSSKVSGDAGGGFPAFGDAENKASLSLADEVNAVYKK